VQVSNCATLAGVLSLQPLPAGGSVGPAQLLNASCIIGAFSMVQGVPTVACGIVLSLSETSTQVTLDGAGIDCVELTRPAWVLPVEIAVPILALILIVAAITLLVPSIRQRICPSGKKDAPASARNQSDMF